MITKIGKHLLLIFLVQMGCASAAHRPYACERAINKSYPLAPFYFLMGATLQQGDCAIIEPLKIEYGEYYLQHRKAILDDLNRGSNINRDFGAINGFSKAFNCSNKASPFFVDLVVKEKNEFFGKNQDNGSRTVTKRIEKSIINDALLSDECKF